MSVHVHICGDAWDVYAQMNAGTCTVTHCDWDQPHKCDMKLEYIWSWFNLLASTLYGVLSRRMLSPRGCVYVCVWVSPPCFLPEKTLLSLLAFPVMSPLPEAQRSCQRQSEMASSTTGWSCHPTVNYSLITYLFSPLVSVRLLELCIYSFLIILCTRKCHINTHIWFY